MARLVLLSILLPLAARAELPEYILVIEHGYPDEVCSPTMDPRTHALGTYITVQDCAIAAHAAGVDTFSYEPDGRFPGTCWKEKVAVSADLFETWKSSTGVPVCPGGGWVNATHTNTYAFAPSARRVAASERLPAAANVSADHPRMASQQAAKVPAAIDLPAAPAPKKATEVPAAIDLPAAPAPKKATEVPAAIDLPAAPAPAAIDLPAAPAPKKATEVPSANASAVAPEKKSRNLLKNLFKRHRISTFQVEAVDPTVEVSTTDPADQFHAGDPADELHADGFASLAQSNEEAKHSAEMEKPSGPASDPADELHAIQIEKVSGPASDPADEFHASDPADELHVDP